MSTLNVETPPRVLLQSLCRAGWGELSGREWQGVRSTLSAIVSRVKGRKALDCTVWQIAQSAGLSEKWTSRCLWILEGLGVIRWQRGFIDEGKPKPGFIEIVRHVLLDLVLQAWKQGQASWVERRAATRRRLALLKKKDAHIRRSRRTELSSDLNSDLLSAPSSAERVNHTGTPQQDETRDYLNSKEPPPAWATGKEEQMNTAVAENPLCPHGYTRGGQACPSCNRINDRPEKRRRWTKKQRAEWRNQRARENMALLEQQTEAKRIAEAAEWARLHPVPAGLSAADWCLVCQSYHPRLEGDAWLEHLKQHSPSIYQREMERQGRKTRLELYSPWG